MRATAANGAISRIVATLDPGAGVVTSRGDVRYVATEYGVADLLGKSVRERAMALIDVAHPDFRSELLGAAKLRRYVFVDQIATTASYPAKYERTVVTRRGNVLLRPSRLTDEAKMSELFYNLSDQTIYKRWLHYLKRLSHHDLLYYLDVDYDHRMSMVAEVEPEGCETEMIGIGNYISDPVTGLADIAFVVRDDWQGEGLGTALMQCLIEVAREKGMKGFSADVLATNRKMMAVFLQSGLKVESTLEDGVYHLTMPLVPAPAPAKAPAAA